MKDSNLTYVNDGSELLNIKKLLIERYSNVLPLSEIDRLCEILRFEKKYNSQDILNGVADKEISLFIKIYANNYERVNEYLEKTCPGLNKEDISRLSKHLRNKYSISYIVSGNASKDIESYLRLTNNSVLMNGEVKRRTPLQTAKKKYDKIIVRFLLTGIITVSALYGKGVITDGIEAKNVSKNIGALASDYSSSESIVEQNTYFNHDSKTGTESFYYSTDGIAQDIIDVCKNNPELLDICLYDVYSNLEYSKLGTMDSVIDCIKVSASNTEELNDITNKLQNVEVFLDYLLEKNYVDKDDEDYKEIFNAIIEYKKCGDYSSLEAKEQKLIDKLIQKYQSKSHDIYKEHKDEIENLVNEKSIVPVNGKEVI